MAHSGSALKASSNDFCEARYQNECWYSMARSKCCCAAALHEVSKCTVPRSVSDAAEACPTNEIATPAMMAAVENAVLIMIASPSPGTSKNVHVVPDSSDQYLGSHRRETGFS